MNDIKSIGAALINAGVFFTISSVILAIRYLYISSIGYLLMSLTGSQNQKTQSIVVLNFCIVDLIVVISPLFSVKDETTI